MDKPLNRFCVYSHTRPDTGAIFYIGIGVSNRPYWRFNRNKLWNIIVAENNGEFIVNVIKSGLIRKECCVLEKELIAFYGRLNNGTGILCNMTDGGEENDGKIITEETRAKLIKARSLRKPITEETRQRMSNTRKGRACSEETKIKIGLGNKGKVLSSERRIQISESQKGKKLSPEHIKKISEYQKRRIVSEETKLKMSIAKSARIISNEERKRMQISFAPKEYTIEQICLTTGVVVGEFLSVMSAQRKTGVNQSSIFMVLKGKFKHAGGFFWRKSYDLTNLDKLIAEQLAA